MKKETKEESVEKRLRLGVEALGGKAYKFISPGQAGVPDRIVMLPGRLIFVELKRLKKGRPSKLQLFQIEEIARLGQEVRILYGEEEVNDFLEEMKCYMTTNRNA